MLSGATLAEPPSFEPTGFALTKSGGAQSFAIDETAANGDVVGTVLPNTLAGLLALDFEITAGNVDAIFDIDDTGVLAVVDASKINHELIGQHDLTVRIADPLNVLNFELATVQVLIGDRNDAPVMASRTIERSENPADGAAVARAQASDEDEGTTLTYAIVGGTAASALTIDASTGRLFVDDASMFDFESHPQLTVEVKATDDGTPNAPSDPPLSTTATLTIDLTDLNERPEGWDRTFAIAENSRAGTVVGRARAVDPDAGQSVRFTVASTSLVGAFAVDAQSGLITVADKTKLNYELRTSATLEIVATDDGSPSRSSRNAYTINLTDRNEDPTVPYQVVHIPESAAVGSTVGTVMTLDPEGGGDVSFAIVGGNDSGAFAIDASTGTITVADNASFDFETRRQTTLRIRATDVGITGDDRSLSHDGLFRVRYDDIRENPVVRDRAVTVAEHSPAGTSLGFVRTKTDIGHPVTYAIVGGNDSGAFAIDSATGRIRVADPAALDFEAAETMPLLIEATDADEPQFAGRGTVTVTLFDRHDHVTVPDIDASLASDAASGVIFATLVPENAHPASRIAYSIVGGNEAGLFAVHPSSGRLRTRLPLPTGLGDRIELTVLARDTRVPTLQDTVRVTISLLD